MMTRRWRARLAVRVTAIAIGTLGGAGLAAQQPTDSFPHRRHAAVFPSCSTCHGQVFDQAQPDIPAPTQCVVCHDGEIERRVRWPGRRQPPPTNRRFTHPAHLAAAVPRMPGDSSRLASCGSCHVAPGDGRMDIRRNVLRSCLDCHDVRVPHVDAPPEACATCHLRLVDAPTLSPAAIRAFPRPTSHADSGFLLGGHGRLARTSARSGSRAVAASCATCHSRDLCLSCHVDAPESEVIQALERDSRVAVGIGPVPRPPSHAGSGYVQRHGREAQRASATCSTCHARESCQNCHAGTPPPAAQRLAMRGPGRAVGADPVRTKPANHTWEFARRHAAEASARPRSCETCHARETCLSCHRPEFASRGAYHPAGFIARHPAAAYSRQAGCADCHNTAQFCQSCHQQSGLVARARLGTRGYHDAFRGFSLGHGQAARQSLESCAGCHAERDCTACHSAVGGGFRFSPHGPGFDGERLRRKNPSFCIACHGTAIPRR